MITTYIYIYIFIYKYIYIDYAKTWNTFMIEIISNSWHEKDKQQIKVVLEKTTIGCESIQIYYIKLLRSALPKRPQIKWLRIPNQNQEEDLIKDHTEEEIEAIKQKKEMLQKCITKIISKKESNKKHNGQQITHH